jgi:ABC-type multidrug transport system ATPase subunit
MSAERLTAGYGKIAVVRDLDLEVREGEILALLGPNGAGKTTTMLTMSGELPALGGEVCWAGRPTKAPL